MSKKAVFIHNSTGSRIYRILPQAKYLASQGWDVKVRGLKAGKRGGIPDPFLKWADIVVVEMTYSPQFIDAIKRSNAKVVYEMDDLMEKVPPKHYAYQDMNWWRTFLTYFCLHKADAITCTVEDLKRHYKWFNSNINVLPNYLDLEFWQKPYLENNSRHLRIGWVGGNCYDNQTEVLTNKGWRFFNGLDKTEKIATLNKDTNEIEYQKPTNYIEEDYSGKMARIEMKHIDLMVTPNHKLLYSKKGKLKKDLEYRLEETGKVLGKGFYLKKDAEWKGKNKKYFILGDKKILMDDWLKFFGFWIAEGWITTSENLYQVGIGQNNKSLIKKIDELLGSFFPHYIDKNGCQIRFFDKQLWSYLKQFGKAHQKFIPQEIKDLSSNKLKILLKWYLLGDGNLEQNRWRAYTVSPKLKDDLQEIALKIGITANWKNRGKRSSFWKKGNKVIKSNYDQFDISFPRTFLRPYVKPKFQKWIDYQGKIYCVEVPNHIIYVRRNGKAVWCGNSHKEDLEFLAPIITKVAKKYPQVKFVCTGYGGTSAPNKWVEFNYGEDLFKDLPKEQYEFSLGVPMNVFPSKIPTLRLDIAVAPVVERPFSRCKSNCKSLEYGLNRIPGVYQKFLYKDSVVDGKTGYLATTADDWYEMICELVEMKERSRKEMGKNAYAHIKDNFSFADHAHKWLEVYNKVLNVSG